MDFSNLSEDFLNRALSIDKLDNFIDFVVTNLPFTVDKKIKYVEEISKLEDMLNSIKKRHEEELNYYFSNFEKNIPFEMKPSNELIDKQRQLEYYIKIEE